MPKIKSINHVAIVVDDIDQALDFWRDSLGLELEQIENVPEQESLVAFLPVGETSVELVEPTSEDSGITRYLKKRGPGMHHICFEVEGIETILEQLAQRGVRLINETPLIGSGGRKYAFIHPESANGVLIELYEINPKVPQ